MKKTFSQKLKNRKWKNHPREIGGEKISKKLKKLDQKQKNKKIKQYARKNGCEKIIKNEM